MSTDAYPIAGDRVRYQIDGLPIFEGVVKGFEPGNDRVWIESELRGGGSDTVRVRLDELRGAVQT